MVWYGMVWCGVVWYGVVWHGFGITLDGPNLAQVNRMFVIYGIMLSWKTYEYYYETDELPNPRPTQPKKK